LLVAADRLFPIAALPAIAVLLAIMRVIHRANLTAFR
jgi:hypothetical protein